MTSRSGALLALGWFVLVASPGVRVCAQVGPQALAGVQARPRVAVSISQQRPDVISALDVHVQITNLTEKDVFLEGAEVILPGDFLAARGNASLSTSYAPSQDLQLAPGNEQLVPFRIPHATTHWYTPLTNPRLLVFYPGEYDVWVQVIYRVPPARETVTVEIVNIPLKPPLSSLVWGGIAGAALLALFVTVYRYQRSSTPPRLAVQIGGALTFFLAGSVCSVIVIILVHRVGDLALPVNIAINDFYGSVAIGLFTYKIGDWLYSLFFGNTDQSMDLKDDHG